MACLVPPLASVPKGNWYCPTCLGKPDEFGFEDGSHHTLESFKKFADDFKKTHFPKVTFLFPTHDLAIKASYGIKSTSGLKKREGYLSQKLKSKRNFGGSFNLPSRMSKLNTDRKSTPANMEGGTNSFVPYLRMPLSFP